MAATQQSLLAALDAMQIDAHSPRLDYRPPIKVHADITKTITMGTQNQLMQIKLFNRRSLHYELRFTTGLLHGEGLEQRVMRLKRVWD